MGTNGGDKLLYLKHNGVPADYYEQGLRSNIFQKYWHQKRFAVIKSFLRNIKGPVLDIGCHSGIVTNLIYSRTKNKTYGIDISKKAIEWAKNKYPQTTFLEADISKIPFPNHFFSTVTCFDILEHLLHLEKSLIEIKRILKPNGHLIVGQMGENILFKIAWYYWTNFNRGKIWRDCHFPNFSSKKLQKILIDLGFKKLKEKYIHFRMWQIIKYQLKNL